MKKCTGCEKELSLDMKFCPYCGVEQEDIRLENVGEVESNFNSFFNSVQLSVNNTIDNVRSNVSSVADNICDLNGDGKADLEDLKIVTDATKKFVAESFDEATKLGKEVIKSDTVKDATAAAVVGAVVAVPIPLVGPGIGAAVGASLSLYKSFMKK